MKITSQIEISELQKKLSHDSLNIDLMNQIALAYFENSELKNNSEDHKYFKQAYETNRTIKSIHNYAWFLYFEWAELHHGFSTKNPICKQALEIQKRALELYPKSFYPYYQLGYMLIDQNKYKESLIYLQKSADLEKRKDIHHNLAFGFIRTNDFLRAKSVLEKIDEEKDLENTSLYNLTLCNIKLGNKQELSRNIKKLNTTIEENHHQTISGYEIAQIHSSTGAYDLALNCIQKQGIKGIHLLDWPMLSYATYQSDKDVWLGEINRSIEWRQNLIQEFKDGTESEDGYTDIERKERLIELAAEIKQIKKVIEIAPEKPSIELKNLSVKDYCGCLLFGCKTHGNIRNDE